jgi:hypothetical protein
MNNGNSFPAECPMHTQVEKKPPVNLPQLYLTIIPKRVFLTSNSLLKAPVIPVEYPSECPMSHDQKLETKVKTNK